jgi:hypothetical protein
MNALKARVENGRIKLDEPTDLPNGKEVSLLLLDDDGLSEEDREQHMKMIDESLADEKSGNVESFSKLIADLRSQL